MPRRIQCRRDRPWQTTPKAGYVGRPSRWTSGGMRPTVQVTHFDRAIHALTDPIEMRVYGDAHSPGRRRCTQWYACAEALPSPPLFPLELA